MLRSKCSKYGEHLSHLCSWHKAVRFGMETIFHTECALKLCSKSSILGIDDWYYNILAGMSVVLMDESMGEWGLGIGTGTGNTQ